MEDIKDINQDIELPFESKKFDIGDWVYAHQIGICTTLIFYLLVAIIFMSAKISMHTQPHTDVLTIDLQQLAELERVRDELLKSVEELQKQEATIDWESVENRVSNEEASTEPSANTLETPPLTGGSETDRLLEEAAAEQRRMEANRAEYERGMAEAQALKESPSNSSDQSAESNNTGETDNIYGSKIEGNVTVSYSFKSPLRYARKLVVPAYLCQGGGKVIIDVVVNQGGVVTNAKVNSASESAELCMQEAALSSALESLFDINKRAPSRHSGRLTYIFVPQ